MNSKVEKLKSDWLAATKAELAIEEMEDYFTYLDELRASGVTNMYGAGPYLQDEFGIGTKQASAVVGVWMATFDAEEAPEDRARKVMTE